MSLDVSLMKVMPVSVYDGNITHNLGKMASEVILGEGLTLYNILWRPDEMVPPLTVSNELVEPLTKALFDLQERPEFYKQFNPPNGWGSYEGLTEFVRKYLVACIDNPNTEISVSR
jgi:hypothetical protein